MNTALIVDGNALMHRAFHALPPFKTSKGIPTHVVYGFFSMLQGTISDFHPSHVLVCFDTPAPTFRNALLETYQAQRPAIANEFKEQIPMTKEALDAAKTVHLELDGYEADDIIGTTVKVYEKNQFSILILTGDKDIMQLVNNSVRVVTPQIGFAKTKVYTPELVKEKLGVEPSLIADWKALVGDPSDNYKGADGIGPKTASKLLEQFGSLDNLLQNVSHLPEGKVKSSILHNLNDIQVSKQLAVIRTDAPVSFPIEQTQWSGFHPNLRTYLLNLEMHSLVSRLFPMQRKITKKNVPKKDEPQMNLF